MPNTPDPQAAKERRERYATAISKWHRDPEQSLYTQGADAVIAVADAEQAELRERLADHENRITWETTCGSCARILDSSIRETEQTEAHRLALSEALGLGTGAPWDAIREQAAAVPSAAETTNRAALLREAADELAALDPAEAALAGQYAFADAAAHLRRRANEAEFAATPCSPVVPCEDGGEPCDVHERLLGHYDDSHELCAPDCGTAGGPSRVAAGEQAAETQAAPPGPGTPRCATCTHPKSDHDGRADHRARFSPLVAGEPWCHACEAPCDYAARPAVGEQPDTQTREAVTVHAVPLPGSNGISSCCGRPPYEFVGERLTRDPDEVTCAGPAVGGAQPQEA